MLNLTKVWIKFRVAHCGHLDSADVRENMRLSCRERGKSAVRGQIKPLFYAKYVYLNRSSKTITRWKAPKYSL